MTLHNLDLALRVDEPSRPTDVSSADERSFYERWEHSNRSCLMVMKYTMDKSIKECVPKMERAKDFLEYVNANYTKIDKAEMTTYLKLLTTTTNIVDVHANSWWLDTGATIHVTNSLQEMTNKRRPLKHEECVYIGDGSKVKMEFLA
ncbi:hypothetical protein AAG906_016376 [Vitis piasezkii]